jgi:hypothetical protein
VEGMCKVAADQSLQILLYELGLEIIVWSTRR